MARPRSVALTGSRARTRTQQQAVHLLVGVASWIALGALWVWQLEVFVPGDWLHGVELILGLGLVWRLASAAWIAWCRSIYRRRHRRTSAVHVEVDFSRDQLGRRTLAPPGLDRTLGHIVVSVPEPTVKRYELLTGQRLDEQARRREPERAGERQLDHAEVTVA